MVSCFFPSSHLFYIYLCLSVCPGSEIKMMSMMMIKLTISILKMFSDFCILFRICLILMMSHLVELFEEGGGGRMNANDSQLEGRDSMSTSSSNSSTASSSRSKLENAKPSHASPYLNKFTNTQVTKRGIINKKDCDLPKVSTNEKPGG